jgi:predicted nucleotidyltransferase
MVAERLTIAVARRAAEEAATALARDRRVRLIYLFGSAVDEARDHVRDVDLAILTEPALPSDELMRIRADAVGAAGAPIDLVSLNDASVVLAHEVADTGRCLFTATPDVEVDFITRARSRYWDYRPFLQVQWQLTGERLAERTRRGSAP